MASASLLKNIGIDILKEFQSNLEAIIIDVREVEEIRETGILPGAINIPLKEVEKAFAASPEEFQLKYGRPKPDKSTPIIFSCRSGKRSSQASDKISSIGYTNVHNFTGGWLEWENHLKN